MFIFISFLHSPSQVNPWVLARMQQALLSLTQWPEHRLGLSTITQSAKADPQFRCRLTDLKDHSLRVSKMKAMIRTGLFAQIITPMH